MKKTINYITFLLLILILLTPLVASTQNLTSNPEVTQIFRPIAVIDDPSSIEILLDAYFITTNPAEVEKLEIIDVTNNGFGPDDIMVVYPSLDVYYLEGAPPEVEEIMRGWSFEDRRRDSDNLPADYFYPVHADTLERWEIDESEIELVENSLIADLLQSLNRNYNTDPISILFERDTDGFTFQMWRFEANEFRFNPRPPAVPDSVAVHDLMYVLYSDSTIVADTTYYDLIYVNRTIEDIIYIPGREDQFRPFETRNLPGTQAVVPGPTEATRND